MSTWLTVQASGLAAAALVAVIGKVTADGYGQPNSCVTCISGLLGLFVSAWYFVGWTWWSETRDAGCDDRSMTLMLALLILPTALAGLALCVCCVSGVAYCIKSRQPKEEPTGDWQAAGVPAPGDPNYEAIMEQVRAVNAAFGVRETDEEIADNLAMARDLSSRARATAPRRDQEPEATQPRAQAPAPAPAPAAAAAPTDDPSVRSGVVGTQSHMPQPSRTTVLPDGEEMPPPGPGVLLLQAVAAGRVPHPAIARQAPPPTEDDSSDEEQQDIEHAVPAGSRPAPNMPPHTRASAGTTDTSRSHASTAAAKVAPTGSDTAAAKAAPRNDDELPSSRQTGATAADHEFSLPRIEKTAPPQLSTGRLYIPGALEESDYGDEVQHAHGPHVVDAVADEPPIAAEEGPHASRHVPPKSRMPVAPAPAAPRRHVPLPPTDEDDVPALPPTTAIGSAGGQGHGVRFDAPDMGDVQREGGGAPAAGGAARFSNSFHMSDFSSMNESEMFAMPEQERDVPEYTPSFAR